MKVGYLIIAHKNLKQVALLAELLADDDNFCFIHIDEKSFNEKFHEYKSLFQSKNCIIIKKPLSIVWGGFSMIEATLLLISTALNFKKTDFDYLSLHSGEDLPLKINKDIHEFLLENNGRQFLEYFEITESTHWSGNGGLDRLEYYWFTDQIGINESIRISNMQKATLVKKTRPKILKKLYGGSQWWTITADCANYVLNKLKDKETYNYFKYSHVPDETLFHSIILNSFYAEKVYNGNLRLIDWKSGPNYPKVFRIDDLVILSESPSLFARKFDMTYDLMIIQALCMKLVNNINT